jgi:hypothetical protein
VEHEVLSFWPPGGAAVVCDVDEHPLDITARRSPTGGNALTHLRAAMVSNREVLAVARLVLDVDRFSGYRSIPSAAGVSENLSERRV